MKSFHSCIVREIRRFGADRTLMIITVIIPVLLTLGYVFMFARGAIENLPFGVVDLDRSTTSRQLVQMIGATPAAEIAAEFTSTEQAHQAMVEGHIDGFIYIPQDFEAQVLNSLSQAEVGVYLNGAFITKASLLRRDLTTVLQALNIGIETQILGSQGIPASQGYQLAYPVTFEKHILFNPFSSYAYYLLPGMLPLVLIIMVALTTVYVVGSEFRYGTAAEWLASADGSITKALVSKILPYLLIFIVIGIFMDTLMYRFMGLPFEARSATVLVLGKAMMVLSYMSIGVLLVAITSNMRFSLSLAAAYTIVAFSFAGLTFPHLAMYRPVAWLANLFPFNFYMDLFIEQSMRGAFIARSLGDLAAMGLFTLLGFAFLPMLKRKALNSKYYGKL